MEKILKKDHSSIIASFNFIQVMEALTSYIQPKLKKVLSQYQHVFEELNGLPPFCGECDYGTPLFPDNQPPDVCPYHHPFV